MRQLRPGDITRKLAQIEHSDRSRRWKRKAKAKLLADVKARPVEGTDHLIVATGRICAKRRFPSFTTAMEALIETWQSPNPKRREKRVHPCIHCKGWHLTSRPLYEGRNYDDRQAQYLKDRCIPQDRAGFTAGQGEGPGPGDTQG